MRRLTLFLVLSILLLATFIPTQARTSAPQALVLQMEGPLTPAWIEYIQRGIKTAAQNDADLIIFQINTPGGSIDLMQSLVEVIRGSEIPIVVYVAPRGAMAGSAGTVITLAGHAAAMAPETIIGAASPVGEQGQDLGETSESKIKEATKAQVRALTGNRPPEAVALAESMIEDAKAVSADEALAAGLIDFIAADTSDLLAQLDGFTLTTAHGEITLETTDAKITSFAPSLIEQLLTVLTNPNVVFLLLSIGAQAILIELSHPGGWVAGFVGVVALTLAIYGLGVLPVNWAKWAAMPGQ